MKYFDFYYYYNKVPDADIYTIIGQRSNGKSTSVGKWLMDRNSEDGSMFAYFTRLANISIARDMEEGNGYFTGYLEEYALTKLHKKITVKENTIQLGENPLCRQFALSLSGKYKSKQYDNKYKYILYEEFVAEDGVYIRNEWARFNSVISTITRNRGATVFLIGNTISRFNPYFENLGIDVMSLNIKAGEYKVIDTQEGVKICMIMCDNVYQRKSEVASILKVRNNEIATTTDWMQSDMVISSEQIIAISELYEKVPVCMIGLQTSDDVDFYIMYSLYQSDRLVCNILTKKLLCEQQLVDDLDILDMVFYIDVNPIECIESGVKSYIDLQKTTSSLLYRAVFSQTTFFEDDRIRHEFHQKLKFNEPAERIGEKY